MQVCDNCGKSVDELTTLVEEFDSMEVCKACSRALGDRLIDERSEFIQKVNRIIDRKRRIAFEEWRKCPPRPAKFFTWKRIERWILASVITIALTATVVVYLSIALSVGNIK